VDLTSLTNDEYISGVGKFHTNGVDKYMEDLSDINVSYLKTSQFFVG
jgi:hypothetical protein